MYRLRVKEVLKEKGVSLGKLSRGADIPINMVRRMVNDPAYQPRFDTLAKVAAYLGVEASLLYYEDNEEKPPES